MTPPLLAVVAVFLLGFAVNVGKVVAGIKTDPFVWVVLVVGFAAVLFIAHENRTRTEDEQ